MAWIKVTNGAGRQVLVNTSSIREVQSDGSGGATLHYIDKSVRECREPFGEVVLAIKNADYLQAIYARQHIVGPR